MAKQKKPAKKKPAKTKKPKLSIVKDDKPKAVKSRKQGQLKGFEQKEIPELTDASEVYQKTVRERLALQQVEADQKAHLMSVVRHLLEEKELKLNPQIPDGVDQIVYRYTDDAGEPREVSVARADMKVKVKVPKKKGDDE